MVYDFDLESKIVLITGGYGYLGKAITESLLYHGAKVFVLGKSKEKFLAAFESKMTHRENLFFEECDVSNTENIKSVFKKIDEEYNINALINNAFYSRGQSPEKMNDADWNYGIEGTLSSTFKCIREIIPFFKKRNLGNIINVSSMYGIVAPQFDIYYEHPEFLNPPHYGASKAGIIQLTKYYANYLGRFGIKVNVVSPGAYPSKDVQEKSGFIENLKKKTSLNKIGKPEDLAGIFVYLVSDASNYMTGQNLIIDGGWTAT